jgi:hypothetical protein
MKGYMMLNISLCDCTIFLEKVIYSIFFLNLIRAAFGLGFARQPIRIAAF